MYRANWIDGNLSCWSNYNQNWERENKNMIVELNPLNNFKSATLEFMNEINKSYGITQNPVTKNYMMVLDNKCKKCNKICNALHFHQNFGNWTSGKNDIDKFIQATQLSVHTNDVSDVLEWISYNRFYNIKCITKAEKYIANWIDGTINYWDNNGQNWIRENQNMIVNLKSLNDIALEFINEIKLDHKIYGITQDPETKNFMMVLNNKCKECNNVCNTIHFQQNFGNWTSGNNDIDKLIQDTQLSVHNDVSNALKWIPYDRFYDIKYIAKGGFGKVYRAIWIDGGEYQNMPVALKSLNNSKNITLKFMNEIMIHSKFDKFEDFIIKFYGMTQDPETEEYIMVLKYADNGSLRNYLDTNYNNLNWYDKIKYLLEIASGLDGIHEKEFIHQDLHSGNILMSILNMHIADMGLCKPADCKESENTKNTIYGVLSYVAPEIIRGQTYTKAADIYSFGVIMYELISGLPPYNDISHDNLLAIKICKGLRPRFNIKVPQLVVRLIKRCLDANPLNRPTTEETHEILKKWLNDLNNNQTELQRQIKEAEEENNNLLTENTPTNLGLSYKTHSEAIYTSRLLNFNNLPEPKNSYDYYEQNDDIISKEFSESLQIDISQLNIIKMENI
ncbi:kinase-like domain-containing protein [Rhizophagus irregularis DAOM 181602=DAOM 197198]|uniref:Kinase-like domain-containing protein n=1 Tax=Rhizophagus irregularis (strain DAOM 181602 / DAOM 197198 / MUCL 43194) TaxID=747089 RepID=A0A2P4PIJ7_RHIID|nr:kinase-like domain-containing protein [Rhizophagus irregularis DAOM 181602=DAOM 197198]POG65200.1 kinase-like domain-containing protein [Rhizophagus irregularis DAOM 181602=DAOM 197198]|eukprot:XP_025172066.1 kinase-like domain-containing protein [Rhizophagus irregularis DAOM 181602=DAOM 197198]